MSPALIARFKEREENVKADIFHAYVALLKQTKPAASAAAVAMATSAAAVDPNSMEVVTAMEEEVEEGAPAQQLQRQVPQVNNLSNVKLKVISATFFFHSRSSAPSTVRCGRRASRLGRAASPS